MTILRLSQSVICRDIHRVHQHQWERRKAWCLSTNPFLNKSGSIQRCLHTAQTNTDMPVTVAVVGCNHRLILHIHPTVVICCGFFGQYSNTLSKSIQFNFTDISLCMETSNVVKQGCISVEFTDTVPLDLTLVLQVSCKGPFRVECV